MVKSGIRALDRAGGLVPEVKAHGCEGPGASQVCPGHALWPEATSAAQTPEVAEDMRSAT